MAAQTAPVTTAMDRLTDAAMEEFARHGFANTTLRSIGARAQMNPMVVAHLCASKGDLATAVVKRLRDCFAEVVDWDVAAIRTRKQWQEAVRAFVSRFTRLACSEKAPYCYLGPLYRFEYNNPKAKEVTLNNQVVQLFRAHLERLMSLSTANKSALHLRLSTLDLWTSLAGFCLSDANWRRSVFPRNVKLSAVIDQAIDYFCDRVFQQFSYVPDSRPPKKVFALNIASPEQSSGRVELEPELPEHSYSELSDEQLRVLWESTLIRRALGGDKLKDSKIVEAIAGCLSDCLGCAISLRQLATAIEPICGRHIAPATVSEYLEALCTGGIVSKVACYDLFTQEVRQTGHVYYFNSPLLRAARFGTPMFPLYQHLVLKNEVIAEFRRRGVPVCVGVYDGRELDFVCRAVEGLAVYMVAPESGESPMSAIQALAALPERLKVRRVLLGFERPANLPDGIEFENLADFLRT